MTKNQNLQRPTVVTIVGLVFILAPLGNFFISLIFSGIKDWHKPAIILEMISRISLLDWSWFSLLIVSGLLLLKAHKTSWTLASFSLLGVFLINLYRLKFPSNEYLEISNTQLVLSISFSLIIICLGFYFRYPYLDRRAHWFFPTAYRYNAQTNVQIVAQDILDGMTESISISGAKILLKRDLGPQGAKMQVVDVLFPQIKNLKICCQIVEYKDNYLRLRFRKMNSQEKAILSDWLHSQNEMS